MGDLTTLANLKAWLNLGQVTESAAIPVGPGPYTVRVAKAAAWNGDAGVLLTATGAPLTPVASDSEDGEYNVAAGVYTFNAAQAGQAASITYTTVIPSDAVLARLIGSISADLQNKWGRQIASQDYTEMRDGHGGQAIFFANYPVTAISLVKVNGIEIPPAPGPLDRGYRTNGKLLMLQGYSFTRGLGNVELAYTAGFAAIPAHVEQLCLELIALTFKTRDRIGQDSASMQGQNITFSKDLSPQALATLRYYQKVVPI